MGFLRLPALAAVAALCSLLASCIDGHEEIWVNADGSGRAELRYDIPAKAARFQGGEAGVSRLVGSLLKEMPSHSHEVVKDGDRLKVRVNLSFRSPDQIKSLAASAGSAKAPSSFQHLAGIFRIAREMRTVNFTRTISPARALPTSFIPREELEGRKLTYIVHLPVAATESSATRVENGGRTLIWDETLTAAIREPVVVHFKADFPVPRWVIATGIAGFIVLAAAGAVVFRLVMKRRMTQG